MEFRFTNDFAVSRLDEIVSFLLGPRLWIPRDDYPDFLAWADKTHRELRREAKRAMVAFRGTDIVGITVYQRHKKDSDALEIKNLTVRPDARGRYIASFLIRNTEIEGVREFGSSSVVCDAKANNLSVRYFLAKHGYRILGRHDLYGLRSGDDLVYAKRTIPLA
ncbi:MAG TPA: GNAT family N-acetyltransferase [Candidatus Paceibacterota bacterium]|nr:GNAT family N-acetyltransferase [Candidatus Paceibacterota bacterium]